MTSKAVEPTPAEQSILAALSRLRRPATVPEISDAIGGDIGDARLYTLLHRMKGQQVEATDSEVVIQGVRLRRVHWSLKKAEGAA